MFQIHLCGYKDVKKINKEPIFAPEKENSSSTLRSYSDKHQYWVSIVVSVGSN